MWPRTAVPPSKEELLGAVGWMIRDGNSKIGNVRVAYQPLVAVTNCDRNKRENNSF